MRGRTGILYLAFGVFFASCLGVLYSLEHGSRGAAYASLGGMAVAGVLFLVSAIPVRDVDWDRISAEQRLWESGPLGRAWLRIRKRLSDLWKL